MQESAKGFSGCGGSARSSAARPGSAGAEMKDSVEFLSDPTGKQGMRLDSVEGDGLLEAVQVRTAIGTVIQMTANFTAFPGIQPVIEVVAKMLRDVAAIMSSDQSDVLHAFMYRFSCPRRNILARRSRDFTAGTVSLRIRAVSSALISSTSRRTKTAR